MIIFAIGLVVGSYYSDEIKLVTAYVKTKVLKAFSK